MNHLLCLALALSVPAAERDEGWVRRRVEAIRKSDTDAWRRIPWCAALTAADRQARREGRPLFVFTHDGNIDTGRC